MNNKFLLSFIACLFAISAIAQPPTTESYEVMLQVAQEYYALGDYYSALDKYKEAYDDRKDKSLLLVMAELQYELRDYRKAESLYRRLIERSKGDKYADKRFVYGRVLKMNGKYSDAIEQFKLFISETTDEKLKELAQNEIAGAEMAAILPENNKGVKVKNLGRKLNVPLSEYSPALGSDGNLYFAGFERDKKDAFEIDESEGHYTKVFTSTKTEKGWQKGSELSEKINRPGMNTNNPSFSKDGKRMYFTRAILKGNNLAESKIYVSEKDGSSWLGAKELEGINGDYIATHPAIGELYSKEVIFFTSDMEGGEGGMDIFYATHKGGGMYGDPVSLGPKINTSADEMTPFYYDGTLFFSSTGHPGIGGADIFYCTWDGATWSEPKNMGKGYNSKVDDIYFRMYDGGYSGFLTSNREGGRSAKGKTCCDDIYGFEIGKIYADLEVGIFQEKVKGKKTKSILGATVQLKETVNDIAGIPNTKTNTKGNKFEFGLDLEKPYIIIASAEGYYPDSTTMNTVGLKKTKSFKKRFYLKKKPYVPDSIVITIEESFVLENILYDFNKDRITESAEIDLQLIYELMTEHADMEIELGSHTDIRGEDNYNEDLSQRRAESARRWLIRRAISKNRIVAKGYGENVPQTVSPKVAATFPYLKVGDVLTEAYINALETEEQREAAHQLNRRTEFTITAGPTSVTIKTKREKKPIKKATPSKSKKKKKAGKKGRKKKKARKKKSSSRNALIKATGTPKMAFDKRMLDLGKVKKGEKRNFSYTFVNKGDTALKISLISACDCTTTDYPTKWIKPGDTGVIKVIFDSADKDESETIDVDIILENTDAKTGAPIIEMLQYKFELIK